MDATPAVWAQTPYLDCKNCGEQTQLPRSMLRDKSLHRTKSNSGELRIIFGCGHCKHVCSYPPELPTSQDFAVDDPFAHPATQDVYEVNIECDGDNCYFPVSVIAVREVHTTDGALRREARTWKFDENVDCPGGFPPLGRN